jgi:hypothetical protein
MMGMEKLLAQMIGMKPEEMAAKVKEFEAFVKGGSSALIEIAENQKKILDRLEAMENGHGKQ